MSEITLNTTNITTDTTTLVNMESDIDVIKKAINENNIVLTHCEYGESFTYSILNNDDNISSKEFVFKINEYTSLATVGAIIKEAVDICYNDNFGYKAYLKDFAFKRTFIKYFTDFPVMVLSYEEMYTLINHKDTSLFEYQMGDLTSLPQYDELYKMFCDEIDFKKNIEIHKSKISQAIDKFVCDIANVENSETLSLTMGTVAEEVKKLFTSSKTNENNSEVNSKIENNVNDNINEENNENDENDNIENGE